MIPIQIKDILSAVGGRLLSGSADTSICAVCTDTRKITDGALFVPLVGERFDANDFIHDALAGGCVASLTSREDITAEKPLIYVPDTRKALGQLAAFYRKRFQIPVVAITGSVGKTTVKELTAAVLSQTRNVLKTDGNFNNEIGLPLTLFRLEESHEAAITEMGMSGFGEIDALAGIATPDIGVVTNIGMSHIENLGSQEHIYQAKAELFPHVAPDGVIILNGDDPILMAHRAEIPGKTVTAGLSSECDFTAEDIVSGPESLSFTIVHKEECTPVTLFVPGEHNVVNALLACAVGKHLGVSFTDIATAFAAYVATDKRMQFLNLDGFTVINDCYNAAPASMKAALHVLSNQSGRKIAVLGDIKELGDYAEGAHEEVGAYVASENIDFLLTLGEYGKIIARGAEKNGLPKNRIASFDDVLPLTQKLEELLEKGDTVLVKASRAMKLERVTEFLTNLQRS